MLRMRARQRPLVVLVALMTAAPPTPVAAGDFSSPPPSPESTSAGIAATGPETRAIVVPYGASGYRYRVYGPGAVPPDWASPTFDDSTFASGAAAFGSGGSCPLQSSVQTSWQTNSEIVVRRTIALPAGATDVRVAIVVDNDAEVRWNGQDVSGGVRSHEFCPARGDFVFSVPAAALAATNTLAVRAIDRGTESFLDVEVTAMVPAAAKPVIFVHGINGTAGAVMTPALYDPLVAEFGPEVVSHFIYYQDRIYRPDPTKPVCQDVADPIMPAEPNGGMPASLDSISPDICDSQSDLAFNAVMLAADVHRRFLETGQKVVLVGNSMGAAIIRGMLSYSWERGDGIAVNEVDSVFFLEGAHDGAEALVQANKNGGRDLDAKLARAFITAVGGIDFNRPAQEDLTPRSAWYQWANLGPGRLADLPYFNAFGNINVVHVVCFLIWCLPPRTILELGDVALAPGTDDPFDTPPKGGARFLHGAKGPQNWQWSMPFDLAWSPDFDPFMAGVVAAALSVPQMHANFLARMSEIRVPDCQTGADTPVDQALLRVVRGRLTDAPYECRT